MCKCTLWVEQTYCSWLGVHDYARDALDDVQGQKLYNSKQLHGLSWMCQSSCRGACIAYAPFGSGKEQLQCGVLLVYMWRELQGMYFGPLGTPVRAIYIYVWTLSSLCCHVRHLVLHSVAQPVPLTAKHGRPARSLVRRSVDDMYLIELTGLVPRPPAAACAASSNCCRSPMLLSCMRDYFHNLIVCSLYGYMGLCLVLRCTLLVVLCSSDWIY